MPFKKGEPRAKGAGRKAGTLNKINSVVAEKLAAMDCDPFEGMAKIAEQAMKEGNYELAGKMFNNLSPYMQPKLSSATLDANVALNGQDNSIWELKQKLDKR